MARNKRKHISEHQDATVPKVQRKTRIRKDSKNEKNINIGPENETNGTGQTEAGPSGLGKFQRDCKRGEAAQKEPPKEPESYIPASLFEDSEDTEDDSEDERRLPSALVETEISNHEFSFEDDNDDDDVTFRDRKCSFAFCNVVK